MNNKNNDNMILKPKKSKSKNYIKLKFPDISVSQCEYSEGPVGLTFIRYIGNKYMVVYKSSRGGACQQINMIQPASWYNLNGINISGGGSLGLESTMGICAESFKHNNYNYDPGRELYNGSMIWTNNLLPNNNKPKIYPDIKLGRYAFNKKNKKLYNGQVGAGLSSNHGQGWAYKEIGDIKILVLTVNNSVGAIYKNDKIIHYPNNASNKNEKFLDFLDFSKFANSNTVVLITNLILFWPELEILNNQLVVSIGDTIKPFNTNADNDHLYVCSTMQIEQKHDSYENLKFNIECSKVLKEAILNSIL
jgi:hypothetical protein